MPKDLGAPHDDIWVLDTSVVLNVLATGVGTEVLCALPCRVVIPERVRRELVEHPIPGLCIDSAMDTWLGQGCAEIVTMSDAMFERYLALLALPSPNHLDDGEASCLAVAEAIGASAALDEKRGRRVATEQMPGVPQQSSATLFHFLWATARLPADVLADALFNALTNARMHVVPETMLDWVVATIGKERARQCHSLPQRARL